MKTLIWNNLDSTLKASVLNRKHIAQQADLNTKVSAIITEVREKGDSALKYYTKLFEQIELKDLKLSVPGSGEKKQLDAMTQKAIKQAYTNIKKFHSTQIPVGKKFSRSGIKAWREYRCIENVGLYVPGGTATLVSTLLMLAIPATIAGCKNIIVVTPMGKTGSIPPAILYAAEVCGIRNLYTVGGAQAIAALAYGTETIPKVMKIFGPGNKYVTAAKLQVSQDPAGAAMDMPAGPSEVLVIADQYANPEFVAADLLAQAEHDSDAQVILVTTCEKIVIAVKNAIARQITTLSRQNILLAALENCLLLIAQDLEQAFAIANSYAPEHLILQINNPQYWLSEVQNAGSVFIGPWSAEALGDYASGPNHVLPTYGYAKNYSGLGVESFMKSISFQEVSSKGLLNLAVTTEILAQLEGLDAHKASISIRKNFIGRQG